jgi:hypothetical protein
VHPEQVPRVRLVRLDPASESRISAGMLPWRRQLAERGQQDARLAEPADGAAYTPWSTTMQLEPQRCHGQTAPSCPRDGPNGAPARVSRGSAGERSCALSANHHSARCSVLVRAAGGDLLDLPYPVAQRLLVDVQFRGGQLP